MVVLLLVCPGQATVSLRTLVTIFLSGPSNQMPGLLQGLNQKTHLTQRLVRDPPSGLLQQSQGYGK